MAYSYTDFAAAILSALNIKVPQDAKSDPFEQEDLAIGEIQRLQRIEVAVQRALAVLRDTNDSKRFIDRIKVVAPLVNKSDGWKTPRRAQPRLRAPKR